MSENPKFQKALSNVRALRLLGDRSQAYHRIGSFYLLASGAILLFAEPSLTANLAKIGLALVGFGLYSFSARLEKNYKELENKAIRQIEGIEQ
ncbi:hypothetical protein A2634_03870 [Candidatus Amesbacteria bacterium RIFCSPHIGHO2_01_FULL_48_32]|uniref:Uncharacterized protein n=1 Tax=Candidatus Amesbacteria bacterium RIFCSPLOWO2_01_FULL_48_25 TaxID=1797259 RepID=A0A1F4ZB74_9BACT|nr:MAG: hypothetical protein A2634_03870 [Candidatus Amesbacteria bacterium RIFCSPHIGHO2_01_FULL_48_32]OGD03493.1 MAG: hypothetical protein A2989_02600 [Candidatus Amesbacteria bacterium RIFCSPLOWO2_01_FULL_48_25]HJZ05801.1 hypothetical protein [Patescibacteria group bacterium]